MGVMGVACFTSDLRPVEDLRLLYDKEKELYRGQINVLYVSPLGSDEGFSCVTTDDRCGFGDNGCVLVFFVQTTW